VIARTWRGWTRAGDAERYVDYMNETGMPGLSSTEGNRGVYMLRRLDGDRAEFVVISLWDSLDAIRDFAGEDIEQAVFYPEDEAFLVERELTCIHYEVPVRVGLR
jgi:heme-degrading monooxygenase HmoA